MLVLLASNIKKVQLAIRRRDTIYPFTSLGYVTQAGGESELLVLIRSSSLTVQTVIPTPCSVWDSKSREWLLRLCFCFSVGWALEMYVLLLPIIPPHFSPRQ